MFWMSLQFFRSQSQLGEEFHHFLCKRRQCTKSYRDVGTLDPIAVFPTPIDSDHRSVDKIWGMYMIDCLFVGHLALVVILQSLLCGKSVVRPMDFQRQVKLHPTKFFLSMKTLKLIQSLSYKFIWESTWSLMERHCIPAFRGRSKPQMVHQKQLAVSIKRVSRIWNHEGVWASWMHKRYIKNLVISLVSPR